MPAHLTGRDQSNHAVEAAAATIVDLLGAVRGVAQFVDSIADASQEQSAGIDQSTLPSR